MWAWPSAVVAANVGVKTLPVEAVEDVPLTAAARAFVILEIVVLVAHAMVPTMLIRLSHTALDVVVMLPFMFLSVFF